jgi:hypothetical protein
MKSKPYKPSPQALLALERLMKHWEVERKDCTPEEKKGFTSLKRRGLVQNRRGTYLRPDFSSHEELDRWFDWLEDTLGVTSETPPAVRSRQVNAKRNADRKVRQQVERN